MLTIAVHRTTEPRTARSERTGVQGTMGLQQEPSGLGPGEHVPPRAPGRAQTQRSPLRVGTHSLVVWHPPL